MHNLLGKCEIKLSREDIAKAIEMYLNDNNFNNSYTVIEIKTSRNKIYPIVVKVE